ncbi:hypothetical protein E4U21_007847 [Claviceps maximensis]|nr:hypothetical protein E4U21_007847 [Claviceps maximensis]
MKALSGESQQDDVNACFELTGRGRGLLESCRRPASQPRQPGVDYGASTSPQYIMEATMNKSDGSKQRSKAALDLTMVHAAVDMAAEWMAASRATDSLKLCLGD